MKLSKQYFKIAEFLAAFFTGSWTKNDAKELEAWLDEDETHRGWMEHLLNPARYEMNCRELKRFSATEGWNRIAPKLQPDNHKIGNRNKIIRCAAAVAALFIVGSIYWLNEDKQTIKESGESSVCLVGERGARLTLNGGKVIYIDKSQSLQLQEEDGTIIIADSNQTDYQTKARSGGEEIWNTVETFQGMEYALTLSDGTKVFLNAETKLTFPVSFQQTERLVQVEGEAYFEVAKDSLHPFIVKTKGMYVRVLGTTFNLRSYPDEEEVVTTLVNGRVLVGSNDMQKPIKPGEQAVYTKQDGKLTVAEVDVQLYTAWHSGKFIFHNESLERVLSYLARWYRFKYSFEDEQIRHLQIGARFDRYKNMKPIIDILNSTELISATWKDGVLHISGIR